MKPRAIKCIECGSFQDWRRYLSGDGTALALLTALVAVLAQSIPVFKEALTPIGENVVVTIPTARYSNYADIFVSNNGREAAIIETDGVAVLNAGAYRTGLFLKPVSNDSNFVVAPGKIVHLRNVELKDNPIVHQGHVHCAIELTIVKLDGTKRKIHTPFLCQWWYGNNPPGRVQLLPF